MDILISSNLERLIYKLAGESAAKNMEFMNDLASKGLYQITDEMREGLSDFWGGYATEEETAGVIKEVYEQAGYIMDTHTAVAAKVYKKYKEATKDMTPAIIASTASPYKFTRSVMNAIDPAYDVKGDFELVDELNRLSKVAVPRAIEEIRTAPVLHNTVCETEKMQEEVEKILGIREA